jgi:hypothetical protein
MTEEKKVIVDDVEYLESALSDKAKALINHLARMDQKVNSAELNLVELNRGRKAFFDDLKDELSNQEVSE